MRLFLGLLRLVRFEVTEHWPIHPFRYLKYVWACNLKLTHHIAIMTAIRHWDWVSVFFNKFYQAVDYTTHKLDATCRFLPGNFDFSSVLFDSHYKVNISHIMQTPDLSQLFCASHFSSARFVGNSFYKSHDSQPEHSVKNQRVLSGSQHYVDIRSKLSLHVIEPGIARKLWFVPIIYCQQ